MKTLTDQDAHYQAQIKQKLKDRWWRLNNLYWITTEEGKRIKFRPNYVQQVLYRSLWYLNIILKSRQLGITTFFCIFFLDCVLFNSNVRAGILAHNREDAENFFRDKVKYAYENLPGWLQEAIPARQDSARELVFTNNSAIRVGTTFVSATLQYLHISELGKISRKYPERAKEIRAGSLNTVHAGQFVAIESTAEGNDGDFYELCTKAKKKKEGKAKLSVLDFKFHFFGWYEDPRNKIVADGIIIPRALNVYFENLEAKHGIVVNQEQKAWYAKKWAILGEDLMFQQHPSYPEEAFYAAIFGTYFASQFKRVYLEKRIAMFPWEEGIPIETWWDLGMNDTNVIWFTQTVSREIHLIDYYENSGEGLAHYVNVLSDKGYKYGRHVAPHDIEVRELGTGVTRRETAAKLGLKFEVTPNLPKNDQIEAARRIMQYCWFHKKNCHEGVKALESYRKEWDDKAGAYRDRPFHNWASHASDAFQIMGVMHKFNVSDAGFTPKRPQTVRQTYDRR